MKNPSTLLQKNALLQRHINTETLRSFRVAVEEARALQFRAGAVLQGELLKSPAMNPRKHQALIHFGRSMAGSPFDDISGSATLAQIATMQVQLDEMRKRIEHERHSP